MARVSIDLEKVAEQFDSAETVGEKYSIALDALGLDGDSFYRQDDQKVETKEEAAKAFESFVGDWGLYILDPEKEPKDEKKRAAWQKAQELKWIPDGTKRVMILPVGHVCTHCGGSEAVLLCIDAEGNVLKGKVVDLG